MISEILDLKEENEILHEQVNIKYNKNKNKSIAIQGNRIYNERGGWGKT